MRRTTGISRPELYVLFDMPEYISKDFNTYIVDQEVVAFFENIMDLLHTEIFTPHLSNVIYVFARSYAKRSTFHREHYQRVTTKLLNFNF